MNGRFTKILLFVLQIILIIAMLGVCAQGFACSLKAGNTDLQVKFGGTAVRCVVILVFAFFYFFGFSTNFEVTGLFIPLYILFEVVCEIRILSDFGPLVNRVIMSPRLAIYVFLFSCMMITFSLLGYGLFQNSQDMSSINYYLIMSVTVSGILTSLLPKPQSVAQIWTTTITIITLMVFFGICAIASIILLITTKYGEGRIRFISILLLLASTFINMFYDTIKMNIIGTVFFCLACVVIIITLKISEGRL